MGLIGQSKDFLVIQFYKVPFLDHFFNLLLQQFQGTFIICPLDGPPTMSCSLYDVTFPRMICNINIISVRIGVINPELAITDGFSLNIIPQVYHQFGLMFVICLVHQNTGLTACPVGNTLAGG